jgi:NAD(P)-dependent dehydrogenase (short-subunit alcohol dehydrogenase family)
MEEEEMTAHSKCLGGKVALVVGSGVPGGIGAATARGLAEDGARLVLADLASSNLAEVSRTLQIEKFEVATCAVDLLHEESVQSLIGFVKKTFGRLDAVINVAAATNIIYRDRGVTDMTAELWDTSFAVNARGPMFVCKHAIPVMIEHGGGSIVNISAGKALRGDIDSTAYSASKAAVNSMTRSIATLYGKEGIRCNAIAAGAIATSLAKSVQPPAMAEVIRDCILVNHDGQPDDIAELVVFLASERSAYITAQTIQCDGGLMDYNPVRYGLLRLSEEARALRPADTKA